MKPISVLILTVIVALSVIGCREKPRALTHVEVREMDGLTWREFKQLDKRTKDIPKNDFEIVSRDVVIIVEKYDMPYGILANDYMPITADIEKVKEHAQPHVFSVKVKTAKSYNFTDKKSPMIAVKLATVESNETPLTVMCLFPVASSQDGHTHIFRSNYFLPVLATCDYANSGKIWIKDRWNLIDNAGIAGLDGAFEIQVVPMQNKEDRIDILASDDELQSRLNSNLVSIQFPE